MKKLMLLVTVAAVAVTASVASGSTSAPTPQTLYLRLLNSTPRLPAGFSDPSVTKGEPSASQRSAGTIGRVDVEAGNAPSGQGGGMLFQVFRTAAQARAAVLKPRNLGKDFKHEGRIPDYPLPSAIITGHVTGDNALGVRVSNGVTLMAVADGNVIVQGASFVFDSKSSGNFAAARKLLTAARAHLKKVRAK